MEFQSPGNPVRNSLDHLYLAYMSHNLRNAVLGGLEQRLKPLGINAVQMAIIYRCYTGDATTLTELSRIIPMGLPTISRQASQLVDKGLLWREYGEEDRRVVRLGLTEKAQKLMPDIERCREENEAALLAGVSDEEKMTLVAIVEKILANHAGQNAGGGGGGAKR